MVVLWDACAELAARDVRSPFFIDRTGTSWALALDGLAWEEPEDGKVAGREKRYLDAESLRLVYVAATRARPPCAAGRGRSKPSLDHRAAGHRRAGGADGDT